MDDLARETQARWDALVAADIAYARPLLDLTPAAARVWLDPHEVMDDPRGLRVLCLGAGGGQQSAAFGVLGAAVTVFDLSPAQLARDRLAADHYGHTLTVEEGDMRDLSRFANASFDMVYHAYSIDFVPDARPVLREVARVLRPGGQYRLQFSNPFTKGSEPESWTGNGYLVPYAMVEGEVPFPDDIWDVSDANGTVQRVPGPKEFRHPLSVVLNTLVAEGMNLLGFWESSSTRLRAIGAPDAGSLEAEPGTWEHYCAFLPPYVTLWARLGE